MKSNSNFDVIHSFEKLTKVITETNSFFLNKSQQQVNTALTLRNWIIGFYIAVYEQSGKDSAKYGKQLYKSIADKLSQKGLQSIRERHLYLCKDFFLAYPGILRTVSAKSYLDDFQHAGILRTPSAEFFEDGKDHAGIDQLLTSLSFSHFIELLKTDSKAKRKFY